MHYAHHDPDPRRGRFALRGGGGGVDIANPHAGLTCTQAATHLGPDVTPAMVSMWALRGWLDHAGRRHYLRVVGRGEKGERLYRYGDLLVAEAATRAKPARSHRTVAERATRRWGVQLPQPDPGGLDSALWRPIGSGWH